MHRKLLLPLIGLSLVGQTAAQIAPRVGGVAQGRISDSDVVERVVQRPDGSTQRVSGVIATTGGDELARAGDFLDRFGDGFGMDDGVELEALRRSRLSPQRLRFAQRVRGHLLVGHGIDILFDDRGSVREAHGVIEPGLDLQPGPVLTADDARQRALQLTGLDPARLAAEAVVDPIARLTAEGLQFVHRVEVVREDHLPLAIEIDARDGSLLRVVENGLHGGAIFKYDDEDVAFPTGGGKGTAYKSIKSAKKAGESSTGLKNLASADVDGFEFQGTLTGRFAQVVDASGLQIYNSASEFAFADDGLLVYGSGLNAILEYQLFDHVNTYCWLDRMGKWFDKALGDFDGDYSVLTYVNYDGGGEGYANALYSPSDPDGEGGYAPGYFLFGEFSGVTDDPMDDLSRDPSIVCHEYTHMVVDKAGGSFGDDDLDTPPRAVNEAIADYAAASSLAEALVGQSFMLHSGADLDLEGEAFRDLQAEITLVDDLWREFGFYTGFPEEHRAGEIFAAALWSMRDAIKPKKADAAVFGSMLAWPMSTAEVGFGIVDTDNVEDCYETYFWGCAEALLDTLLGDGDPKAQKDVAKTLGAFMRHGISGSLPDTTYSLDLSEGGKLKFDSAFLGSIDEHTFEIELLEGQRLTLSVKGVGGTSVEVALDGDDPDGLAVAVEKANKGGTSMLLGGVDVLVGGTYSVVVSDPSGEGGRYKLALKVK